MDGLLDCRTKSHIVLRREFCALQGETVNELRNQSAELQVHIANLNEQVYDLLSSTGKAKKDFAESKEEIDPYRDMVIGITSALCAVFVPFLCCATAAGAVRKRETTKTR